ncbi:MAG TPA: haloacid dehalogenase type II [Anaerolineales bacterium]|nr:haloacid dehalogenase type II [Anaerolineales bacterium]
MPVSHRYQLITLDVYTALFDIEGSLVPVVQQLLKEQVDATELVHTWRQKQLEYALISNSLQQGRVPFAVITRRALDYTLSRVQMDLSDSSRQSLVAEWDRLQLWPEAAQVLSEVKKRGYAVGLLSNGDEAMLQALASRLPIKYDHIFASEPAGYYKPHPSIYELPLKFLGLTSDQVLHVAGSATDVMGTKAAGLPCAWSNRKQDRVLDSSYQADYEFANLLGLLKVI